MVKKEIFITGLPHSGKSTLLSKTIENISCKQGFITLEIPGDDGHRSGFKIVTAKGTERVLASTNFKTPIKVSRYSVDISNLDSLIPELSKIKSGDILYIDEIGQMELYSDNFKQLVINYLNSDNTVIFTISKIYSDEFTQKLLSRPNIHLVEVTPDNRQEAFIHVMKILNET